MGFIPQGFGQGDFGGLQDAFGGQNPQQQDFMNLLGSFLGGQGQQGGFGALGGQGQAGEIDEELLMSLLGGGGFGPQSGGGQEQALMSLLGGGSLGGGSLGGFFNGGGL